jgi:hypothetical protein
MRVSMVAMLLALLMVPQVVAAAPILQASSGGILTGATGVDVNGTLYDVQFVDGSCVAGCVLALNILRRTQ